MRRTVHNILEEIVLIAQNPLKNIKFNEFFFGTGLEFVNTIIEKWDTVSSSLIKEEKYSKLFSIYTKFYLLQKKHNDPYVKNKDTKHK